MTLSLPFTEPAPTGKVVAYDRWCAIIYLRLLDAEAAGADWREVAEAVLGLDWTWPEDFVRRLYDSHLRRARWLRDAGHRGLLGLPDDSRD